MKKNNRETMKNKQKHGNIIKRKNKHEKRRKTHFLLLIFEQQNMKKQKIT